MTVAIAICATRNYTYAMCEQVRRIVASLRGTALQKRIRECPLDGNIWQVIGQHGWRPRVRLDHAYPAIGRGAVLSSDWCGFGCALLNRRALELAHFDGYDGKGVGRSLYVRHRPFTEDTQIH